MAGAQSKRRLVLGFAATAAAMFGFGYLLVPLYAVFCRVTGFNQIGGADAVASAMAPEMSRTVTMQFDSNVRDDLPWAFRPLQSSIAVHPGQLVQVAFEASNSSDRAIIGQAVASYAPQGASAYVRKVQCFCFSTQTLAPHEVRRMPVLFMIDPSLPKEVSTLTLSYTFFYVGASASTLGRGT